MNMRKLNNQKFTTGFTLIELLVVIAIIGILSGIVLTSLGSARNKAKIASASATMSSMRAQAELGVDNSGNYVTGICGNSTDIGGLASLIESVENQSGTGTVVCNQYPLTGQPTAWAASVDLGATNGLGATGDNRYFCVDNTAKSGSSATVLASGITVCP